jgi:tripartite motif-containing protein 71
LNVTVRDAVGRARRVAPRNVRPAAGLGTHVSIFSRSRTTAALAAAASVAVVLPALPATAGAQVACPGATAPCPYVAAGEVGQRSGGVLRFPQAIAIGPDGIVYVGDQHSRVVHAFAPDGTFLREIGVPGTRPGELSSVGALAVAPDNTLFVADGRNRIDRFDSSGRLLRSFGRPGTGVGQFRFGAGGGNDAGAGGGLAASSTHLFVADSGNDRIQRFELDGGAGMVLVPPGQLAYPKGLAVRGTRLLVADDQNHRIRAYDTGGRLLSDVGRGEGNGPGQLSFPYGVALDAAGRMFVADNLNHRIVRFGTAPQYKYVSRWGGFGTGPGRMAYVRGLAIDPTGNVYVANTGNDRIDVFDREGRQLRSFGRSGRAEGQFNNPAGVAADAQGYRAVTDSINGRVEFLDPSGRVLTSWGSPNPGPTVLPRPVAVAFDGAGTAYVLDQRRGRILVFSRATGQPVRSIGTQGSGPGQMSDPSALAITAGGTLVVADTGNRRIVRFRANGEYLGAQTGTGAVRGVAVTPEGGLTYASDTSNRIRVYAPDGREVRSFGGTGNKLGKLNAPAQITLDAAGNLWVADRGNNRVQQFGPNGERLRTLGRRGTGTGEFTYPTGVSVDCNGLLTVTDQGNNRVQQFLLAAPAAAPCAPLPPLGTPPAPKSPTLPPPPGPEVDVRVLRASKLLTMRSIPLRVRCDTTCTVRVTGDVSERSAPKPARGKKRRDPVSVKLRPTTLELGAAQSKIVRPSLTRDQVSKLRKALRSRRGLTFTLTVAATSATDETSEVPVSRDATG